MRLVVVHHHFRPGGVRRVIELALPALVAGRPRVGEVVLAGGTPPDSSWFEDLRSRVGPVALRSEVEPALGYREELRWDAGALRRRLRAWVSRVTDGTEGEVLVWAHNPGLGRNLVLVEELAVAVRAGRLRGVWHHHDWWFDNRWQRWPELRRSARSLEAVARSLLARETGVVHVAINRADAALLRRGFGSRVRWLPNPVDLQPPPSARAAQAARRWVAEETGSAATQPYWLLPARFVRRKNVPEAILLTRWLRPGGWLVTTGGPSSEDERASFERLRRAVERHRWPVALGILARGRPGSPSVSELIAGSEAVAFTSLIEGFGLPYLEAAMAGRPLIGRSLPRVLPDLSRFGVRFPTVYSDLRVAPQLFDWAAEALRQEHLFAEWRARLPTPFRPLICEADLPVSGRPRAVSFRRLTLTAQLEVLAQPAEVSWRHCWSLNPQLDSWRERAERGSLPAVVLPERARRQLAGEAYARRFWQAVAVTRQRRPVRMGTSTEVQDAMVRDRLSAENLFPVLWAPET